MNIVGNASRIISSVVAVVAFLLVLFLALPLAFALGELLRLLMVVWVPVALLGLLVTGQLKRTTP